MDPATIIAITEAAGFVVGLFKGNDFERDVTRALQDIGTWITQVDARLQEVNNQLVEVREGLAQLHVHIDESFTKEAEIVVLARCRSYVENIPALKANPQSAELRHLFVDIYGSLQPAVRTLMMHGYAPLISVSYGMRVELDLIRLLAIGPDTERSVAADYARYFTAALDEAVPGSVTNVLQSTRASLASLSSQFTAGCKGSVGRAWWYYEHKNVFPGFFPWRLHSDYTIDGSLETGFTARIEHFDHYRDSDHEPKSDYFFDENAALTDVLSYVNSTLLPPYNRASATYKEQVKREEVLRQIVAEFHELPGRIEKLVAVS